MKWLSWSLVVLTLVAMVFLYRFWRPPERPVAPVAETSAAVEPNYFRSGVAQVQDDGEQPDARSEANAHYSAERESITEQQLSWRAEQMRNAFLHGDDRAPPLAPRDEANQRELPTAEELADPELYQQYEARQQQGVRESFVRAARKQITELEQQLQQAREMEGDPAQLAEGEEKLERLRELYQQTLQESPQLQALIEQAAQQPSASGDDDSATQLAPDQDGPLADDDN